VVRISPRATWLGRRPGPTASLVAVAVVGVVATLLVVGASSSSLRRFVSHQMRESTQQLPTRYAQLYFPATTEIPIYTTVAAGVTLPFVVRPHGWPRSERVRGLVMLSVGGGPPRPVTTFTVSGDNTPQTFRAVFKGPSTPDTFRLEVTVPALALSIYALGRTRAAPAVKP
jgi:hypothetical protein